MTYQEFLTAYRSNGATVELAEQLNQTFAIKRFKHWSQATFIQKVADEALRHEKGDQVRAEEEARKEAYKAELAARAAERADVDAWISSRYVNDRTSEYNLAVAVKRAQSILKSFAVAQAEYVERLAKDPVYALSWSGQFCEAAADAKVARWVLDGFEMGCTVEVLADEALRETLRAAKGSSRSTSIMSNLMDDVMGVAWTKTYERLSGKSFW
jgi:hypothetical protein